MKCNLAVRLLSQQSEIKVTAGLKWLVRMGINSKISTFLTLFINSGFAKIDLKWVLYERVNKLKGTIVLFFFLIAASYFLSDFNNHIGYTPLAIVVNTTYLLSVVYIASIISVKDIQKLMDKQKKNDRKISAARSGDWACLKILREIVVYIMHFISSDCR